LRREVHTNMEDAISEHSVRIPPPLALESVATILEGQMQPTIDDWYQRLTVDNLVKGPAVSEQQRSSHLPDLFSELIHRLRNPVLLNTGEHRSRAAAAHGLLRLAQGYAAAVLIEESRCLQVSIFNTLNVNAHYIDFNKLLPDVMVIADEVDAQLAVAIASYAAGVSAASVSPTVADETTSPVH